MKQITSTRSDRKKYKELRWIKLVLALLKKAALEKEEQGIKFLIGPNSPKTPNTKDVSTEGTHSLQFSLLGTMFSQVSRSWALTEYTHYKIQPQWNKVKFRNVFTGKRFFLLPKMLITLKPIAENEFEICFTPAYSTDVCQCTKRHRSVYTAGFVLHCFSWLNATQGRNFQETGNKLLPGML